MRRSDAKAENREILVYFHFVPSFGQKHVQHVELVLWQYIVLIETYDGWMDGWMSGWMNGWMDGWMDGCVVAIF